MPRTTTTGAYTFEETIAVGSTRGRSGFGAFKKSSPAVSPFSLTNSGKRCVVKMASRGGDKLIKLGWLGAGGINFGSLEGPWNHAVRMQKQNNVQFTAVVDPNLSVAQVFPHVFVAEVLLSTGWACADMMTKLLTCRNVSSNISKDHTLANGQAVKLSRITKACFSPQQSLMG